MLQEVSPQVSRIRPKVAPLARDESPGIHRLPEVLYQDDQIRVVRVGDVRIVEVPWGREATGRVRWQRARLIPEHQPDVVLEGWKAIGQALGVSKLDTLLGYARRDVDPLPARVNAQGKVWIFMSVLRAWAAANTLQWKQRRLFVDEDRKRRRARSSKA